MDPETAVAEDNEAEQEPQLEAEAQSADAPEATDPNKPDYFPQKLWGDGVQYLQEDGSLNHEAMGASLSEAYTQAERRIFMRTEDLREEIANDIRSEVPKGVPEEASGYELDLDPLILPDGYNFEVDENDPLLTTAKDILHQYNVPQAKFNELAEAYIGSSLAKVPDYDVEKQKLGEYSDMRCERVNSWCQRHLSEGAYETMSGLAVQSEMIEAVEEIMELAGEPKFMVGEDTGHFQERLTRADIAELQNSPEYRRGDAATLQRVRSAWALLAEREARG